MYGEKKIHKIKDQAVDTVKQECLFQNERSTVWSYRSSFVAEMKLLFSIDTMCIDYGYIDMHNTDITFL